MNIILQKSGLAVGKDIVVSGSKSESNRLLILQQLFPELTIANLSNSDDVQAMLNGLSSQEDCIDVHHAGTTMRFLTAFYSLCTNREITLTGSHRMQERPIGVLVDALGQLGACITYDDKTGYPPLKIKGVCSKGGKVVLPADISSQYITALLLIGTKFEKGLVLQLVGKIASRPYIEMTLALIAQLGCTTSFEGNVISISQLDHAKQTKFTVESDWSSASYFYGLIALGNIGDEVKLSYFKENSLQGDSEIVPLYAKLGVQTFFQSDDSILIRKVSDAHTHFSADLVQTPDLAQTIAVTCFGMGISCSLTGLHTLKIKETDRLLALECELTKLGAIVSVTDSSLELQASSSIIADCKIDTYQDHRMAMSFAILARKTNLVIKEAEVVSKSFVDYWLNLRTLGIEFVSEIK